MESNELQTTHDNAPATLSAKDIKANVQLIQSVMQEVMQPDTHYGVIPGTKENTLYKPGAEKIMSTFRLAARPIVEDMSDADAVRYRVTCEILGPSGQYLGGGIGECSSNETKYKWRGAVSAAEYDATPENRRRIKFTKQGSFNQVRTEPADMANTVLKMAKKRALVDAVLTVTAASDIFTQDLEDADASTHPAPAQQPSQVSQPAQRKGQPQPATEAQQKLIVKRLEEKGLTMDHLPYVKWPNGITKSDVNDVLAWIDAQEKPAF